MSEEREDFGLVTWGADDYPSGNNGNKRKDEFIRLSEGSNLLRVVTQPFQYWYHKYKENASDPGYGDKVMCSKYHDSCPLCDMGVKRTRRWYIGVIDRKTQSYKVLDMSPSIFFALKKLNKNDAWGDPGRYDIDVVVDKDGGATGYYTVIPQPPTNLSTEDVEIKKSHADSDELKRKCSPPTPDKVLAKLAFIKDRNNNKRNKGSNKEAVAAAPAPETDSAPQPAQQENESDYTFPAVN